MCLVRWHRHRSTISLHAHSVVCFYKRKNCPTLLHITNRPEGVKGYSPHQRCRRSHNSEDQGSGARSICASHGGPCNNQTLTHPNHVFPLYRIRDAFGCWGASPIAHHKSKWFLLGFGLPNLHVAQELAHALGWCLICQYVRGSVWGNGTAAMATGHLTQTAVVEIAGHHQRLMEVCNLEMRR